MASSQAPFALPAQLAGGNHHWVYAEILAAADMGDLDRVTKEKVDAILINGASACVYCTSQTRSRFGKETEIEPFTDTQTVWHELNSLYLAAAQNGGRVSPRGYTCAEANETFRTSHFPQVKMMQEMAAHCASAAVKLSDESGVFQCTEAVESNQRKLHLMSHVPFEIEVGLFHFPRAVCRPMWLVPSGAAAGVTLVPHVLTNIDFVSDLESFESTLRMPAHLLAERRLTWAANDSYNTHAGLSDWAANVLSVLQAVPARSMAAQCAAVAAHHLFCVASLCVQDRPLGAHVIALLPYLDDDLTFLQRVAALYRGSTTDADISAVGNLPSECVTRAGVWAPAENAVRVPVPIVVAQSRCADAMVAGPEVVDMPCCHSLEYSTVHDVPYISMLTEHRRAEMETLNQLLTQVEALLTDLSQSTSMARVETALSCPPWRTENKTDGAADILNVIYTNADEALNQIVLPVASVCMRMDLLVRAQAAARAIRLIAARSDLSLPNTDEYALEDDVLDEVASVRRALVVLDDDDALDLSKAIVHARRLNRAFVARSADEDEYSGVSRVTTNLVNSHRQQSNEVLALCRSTETSLVRLYELRIAHMQRNRGVLLPSDPYSLLRGADMASAALLRVLDEFIGSSVEHATAVLAARRTAARGAAVLEQVTSALSNPPKFHAETVTKHIQQTQEIIKQRVQVCVGAVGRLGENVIPNPDTDAANTYANETDVACHTSLEKLRRAFVAYTDALSEVDKRLVPPRGFVGRSEQWKPTAFGRLKLLGDPDFTLGADDMRDRVQPVTRNFITQLLIRSSLARMQMLTNASIMGLLDTKTDVVVDAQLAEIASHFGRRGAADSLTRSYLTSRAAWRKGLIEKMQIVTSRGAPASSNAWLSWVARSVGAQRASVCAIEMACSATSIRDLVMTEARNRTSFDQKHPANMWAALDMAEETRRSENTLLTVKELSRVALVASGWLPFHLPSADEAVPLADSWQSLYMAYRRVVASTRVSLVAIARRLQQTPITDDSTNTDALAAILDLKGTLPPAGYVAAIEATSRVQGKRKADAAPRVAPPPSNLLRDCSDDIGEYEETSEPEPPTDYAVFTPTDILDIQRNALRVIRWRQACETYLIIKDAKDSRDVAAYLAARASRAAAGSETKQDTTRSNALGEHIRRSKGFQQSQWGKGNAEAFIAAVDDYKKAYLSTPVSDLKTQVSDDINVVNAVAEENAVKKNEQCKQIRRLVERASRPLPQARGAAAAAASASSSQDLVTIEGVGTFQARFYNTVYSAFMRDKALQKAEQTRSNALDAAAKERDATAQRAANAASQTAQLAARARDATAQRTAEARRLEYNFRNEEANRRAFERSQELSRQVQLSSQRHSDLVRKLEVAAQKAADVEKRRLEEVKARISADDRRYEERKRAQDERDREAERKYNETTRASAARDAATLERAKLDAREREWRHKVSEIKADERAKIEQIREENAHQLKLYTVNADRRARQQQWAIQQDLQNQRFLRQDEIERDRRQQEYNRYLKDAEMRSQENWARMKVQLESTDMDTVIRAAQLLSRYAHEKAVDKINYARLKQDAIQALLRIELDLAKTSAADRSNQQTQAINIAKLFGDETKRQLDLIKERTGAAQAALEKTQDALERVSEKYQLIVDRVAKEAGALDADDMRNARDVAKARADFAKQAGDSVHRQFTDSEEARARSARMDREFDDRKFGAVRLSADASGRVLESRLRIARDANTLRERTAFDVVRAETAATKRAIDLSRAQLSAAGPSVLGASSSAGSGGASSSLFGLNSIAIDTILDFVKIVSGFTGQRLTNLFDESYIKQGRIFAEMRRSIAFNSGTKGIRKAASENDRDVATQRDSVDAYEKSMLKRIHDFTATLKPPPGMDTRLWKQVTDRHNRSMEELDASYKHYLDTLDVQVDRVNKRRELLQKSSTYLFGLFAHSRSVAVTQIKQYEQASDAIAHFVITAEPSPEEMKKNRAQAQAVIDKAMTGAAATEVSSIETELKKQIDALRALPELTQPDDVQQRVMDLLDYATKKAGDAKQGQTRSYAVAAAPGVFQRNTLDSVAGRALDGDDELKAPGSSSSDQRVAAVQGDTRTRLTLLGGAPGVTNGLTPKGPLLPPRRAAASAASLQHPRDGASSSQRNPSLGGIHRPPSGDDEEDTSKTGGRGSNPNAAVGWSSVLRHLEEVFERHANITPPTVVEVFSASRTDIQPIMRRVQAMATDNQAMSAALDSVIRKLSPAVGYTRSSARIEDEMEEVVPTGTRGRAVLAQPNTGGPPTKDKLSAPGKPNNIERDTMTAVANVLRPSERPPSSGQPGLSPAAEAAARSAADDLSSSEDDDHDDDVDSDGDVSMGGVQHSVGDGDEPVFKDEDEAERELVQSTARARGVFTGASETPLGDDEIAPWVRELGTYDGFDRHFGKMVHVNVLAHLWQLVMFMRASPSPMREVGEAPIYELIRSPTLRMLLAERMSLEIISRNMLTYSNGPTAVVNAELARKFSALSLALSRVRIRQARWKTSRLIPSEDSYQDPFMVVADRPLPQPRRYA